MIVIMEAVYLSAYINASYTIPDTGEKIYFIKNKDTRDYVIFLAFWFGIYRSEDISLSGLNQNSHIISVFAPFYLMFVTLIIERACQFWLTDRFGCTNEE